MRPDSKVERIELVVRQFNLAQLLDVPRENVELFVHHRLEMMAHQIKAQLLVPSKKLQGPVIVAEYPIDWWQAIRARLGWKHRTRVHFLSEYLHFPKIPVPQWARDGDHMAVHYYENTSAVRDFDGSIDS